MQCNFYLKHTGLRVLSNWQMLVVWSVCSVEYWRTGTTDFDVFWRLSRFKTSYLCCTLKHTEWWGAGILICLEWGADLHMAQLMPLPLTVSCFSKIQTGFTFLVPAHPGSPGQRAIKWVCVLSVLHILVRPRLTAPAAGSSSCSLCGSENNTHILCFAGGCTTGRCNAGNCCPHGSEGWRRSLSVFQVWLY